MGDYVFRKEYNHNMFTFLEVNCRKTSRQEVYKHWARRAGSMHIMGEHYTLHLQIPLVGDHENHEMLGAQAEKRVEDRDITPTKI